MMITVNVMNIGRNGVHFKIRHAQVTTSPYPGMLFVEGDMYEIDWVKKVIKPEKENRNWFERFFGFGAEKVEEDLDWVLTDHIAIHLDPSHIRIVEG